MRLWLPLLLDAGLPDPPNFFHPIVWIGRLISQLERFFYRLSSKRLAGFALWCCVLAVCNAALQLRKLLPATLELIVFILLALLMFSGRTLAREARKIERSLQREPIERSRKRLSWIVGRDTEHLAEHEIIRATIETVAENTVDGLIAPAFYFLVGSLFGVGLEALVSYKAVNTMDSMLGYKNERYADFGYYPARLDDGFNYLPARLGALLMLVAVGLLGYPLGRSVSVLLQDRRAHASPNAGYPEAVVSGALGIQMGGLNRYGNKLVVKPSIGQDQGPVVPAMITQAVHILQMTQALLVLIAWLWTL